MCPPASDRRPPRPLHCVVRQAGRIGLPVRADGDEDLVVTGTAHKAFIAALVTLGVVVLAPALWKLRLVVALLFAGYRIFERERAMNVVTELLPRPKRKVVRDTWLLIDLKLGTPTPEQEREALRDRDPAFIERVQRLTARYPEIAWSWHAVRRHFGISSFGVNASKASEG